MFKFLKGFEAGLLEVRPVIDNTWFDILNLNRRINSN